MDIRELIAKLAKCKGCSVHPANGLPVIEKQHRLPNDVIEFYENCGGISMFESSNYALEILPPERVKLANPIIIGDIEGIPNNGMPVGDASESWYVIAHDYNGDFLTIDFGLIHLGRCYDSFHELHPGNSPIIAMSFSDFLRRILENGDGERYWIKSDFISMGEAAVTDVTIIIAESPPTSTPPGIAIMVWGPCSKVRTSIL